MTPKLPALFARLSHHLSGDHGGHVHIETVDVDDPEVGQYQRTTYTCSMCGEIRLPTVTFPDQPWR